LDKEQRAGLQAAGFRFGDAADFLELSEEECNIIELRLTVSRAVRSLREKAGVTQQQLAQKLKSSPSRVAKIEAAASDVSLDLSLKALFAVGGELADLVTPRRGHRGATRKRRSVL
jgi:DNA-binding XRE family transcriptional regulator